MLKRHKHEWEKLSELIVPSFYERFEISGIPNMGAWVYERKLVVFMKCRCGKIKRIIHAK